MVPQNPDFPAAWQPRPDPEPGTKIVATLGPATDSEASIRKLAEAGVDVFRCNASHGTHAEHGRRIERVRAVNRELGIQAAVLLDLQGPKIRLGHFDNGGCELADGDIFTITTDSVTGNSERASIDYASFAEEVRADDRILIADGTVELRVLSTSGSEVRCRVVEGGFVGDRKGVNLPGVQLSTPALTEKDLLDLDFGIESGIDLVALSFVRTAEDVRRLRQRLVRQQAELPVIAKIEKPEAWDNISEILVESDGVMVARGDLGVEMALERVPYIQKSIIDRAREAGKFVITATQMLESMVQSPTPTRAEVSDVANAIYDGTDAVMLSAETSTGRYAVGAARMMTRIALEAEKSIFRRGFRKLPLGKDPSCADVIVDAAFHAAQAATPAAIVVLTGSGHTARLMAKHHPPVPIYAFTTSESVVRRLQVVYGVRPMLVPKLDSTEAVFREVDQLLLAQDRLRVNDKVIVLAGLPTPQMGPVNMMKLHRVGETRTR